MLIAVGKTSADLFEHHSRVFGIGSIIRESLQNCGLGYALPSGVKTAYFGLRKKWITGEEYKHLLMDNLR